VIGIFGKKSWGWKVILGIAILVVYSAALQASDSIKGVVRNQTRGRPAAGAEVILLRRDKTSLDQNSLNQIMQEETRTETDSQGSFTLDVHDPDKPHLVRAVHEGVNYDYRAATGDSVSIDVFDALPKVQGVTGSIEIIRIGTADDHLHVSDMVELRNASNPPLTQVGERAFEVYLPAHATIDSVLAAGPGQIAALISAAPVADDPGHYTVNFPLQPGATKFAINYDLPYEGHATFRPKSMYPLQQLAVMIPPTMKFTSQSPAFHVLGAGNDRYHVEAANVLKAGDGPGFEIWGVGALSALRAQAQSPPKPPVPGQPTPPLSAPTSVRARTQGANSSDVVTTSGNFAASSGMLRWVLGASAVMLVVCGLLFWRRQRRSTNAMAKAGEKTGPRADTAAFFVAALKEELLRLEIDRSLCNLSSEEYGATRQALEETVKRARARTY
jgi:hypothetical protein